MTEVVIYTAKDGHVELDVSLVNETVWLSMNQMMRLFGRDKSVISRHINNTFKTGELYRGSTVTKFATVQKEGDREVEREIEYYNLDVIISVGYRVNSKEGVQFRQWASGILKEHLIRGYTINKKQIAEQGIQDLQQSVELLQKTLMHHETVSDIGQEAMQLILSYAKTWNVLVAFDEGKLELPVESKEYAQRLDYKTAFHAIEALKNELVLRDEATHFFGQEREDGLHSILNNIEQTFDGNQLYKSIEEKAAHLLYFVIKDHPFTYGNKRIGCFVFLLYLKLQKTSCKFNDNGLVALALLIAESDPKQKNLIIRLITNLLTD